MYVILLNAMRRSTDPIYLPMVVPPEPWTSPTGIWIFNSAHSAIVFGQNNEPSLP